MKVERDFIMNGERYDFDFGECSVANDFAQIDTCQDAWYFGTWTDPFDLTIVNYAEGDVTTQTAESDVEYVKAIRELKAWYEEMERRFIGIDTMLSDRLTQRFTELGLSDLLH